MVPALLALSFLLVPITFLDVRFTKRIAAREGVPVSRIETNPIVRGLMRLRIPYAWEFSEYSLVGIVIVFVLFVSPGPASFVLSLFLSAGVLFRAGVVARSYLSLTRDPTFEI